MTQSESTGAGETSEHKKQKKIMEEEVRCESAIQREQTGSNQLSQSHLHACIKESRMPL